MKVRCSEGGAIHTGPESCAGRREASGEALTGDDIGQPLSGESPYPGCRCCYHDRRQYELERSLQDQVRPGVVEDPGMYRRFSRGNREVSTLVSVQLDRDIVGKLMNHKPMRQGVEKSDAPIVPAKRANKAGVSAAERVEGSGAKERNAVLQSTDRTRDAGSSCHMRKIAYAKCLRFASCTHLKSRMRESRPSGSVRGAISDDRPYRDHIPRHFIDG